VRSINILLIGGAGSGKSHLAQELALKLGGAVLFVATAVGGDEEMLKRIDQHRRKRPPAWSTLEVTTEVGKNILKKIGDARVVIVDCITLLANNIFSQYSDQGEQIDAPLIEKRLNAEIEELIECTKKIDASFIIVTNEVGLGVVPPTRLGRLYRDLLARANQKLAEAADEVYLMVAGLAVPIKPAKK
jgi:adenosylcobinamide kinase/adenosylcobinamide-phosphate guanylyltransferase